MDTQTVERPDVTTDETTEDDTPKFFHYVKKDKIVESAVMGEARVPRVPEMQEDLRPHEKGLITAHCRGDGPGCVVGATAAVRSPRDPVCGSGPSAVSSERF